jgi:mpaB/rubber oxygenase-like protein
MIPEASGRARRSIMRSGSTGGRLDVLRFEGDPVPDDIVAAIAERGQTLAVNRILHRLVDNSATVPAELPDDIEAWLTATEDLPVWVDRARIDRASAFFVEHGLQLALILSTAALVFCYADTRGVRALTFTYRMAQNPYRRAAETSQFVLYALAPGGLYAGGQGIRAIQKVRLMHAAIRHLIRATGQWPEAEVGVPICQEDMLLTLMSFSYGVVEGLGRLGVDIEPAEAEDYLYTWCVIGRMLGVRAEILPHSMAEAARITQHIAKRQFGPSPDGILMTRALLEMHERLIPGEAFDGVLPAIVRLVVGHRIGDWLEIPRSRWDRIVRYYPNLGRYLEVIDRASGSVGDLADHMGLAMLTRVALSATDYERPGFEIPTELRTAWAERGHPIEAARG